MTVLSFVLAGPLQSWGSSSRFTTRSTDPQPTKSGVIGMLAAARGLRRTDPLEDLLSLRFGVRVEQQGELVRDFQTARSLVKSDVMPLSYRHYRADARYLVGLEGERTLLEAIAETLRHPAFPLYLGRRSCPPSEPIVPAVRDWTLEELLVEEPWRAADWYLRRSRGRQATLAFTIDEVPGEGRRLREPLASAVAGPTGTTTTRDEPISFDPERRIYGWRTVIVGEIRQPGAGATAGLSRSLDDDDPGFMEALA